MLTLSCVCRDATHCHPVRKSRQNVVITCADVEIALGRVIKLKSLYPNMCMRFLLVNK